MIRTRVFLAAVVGVILVGKASVSGAQNPSEPRDSVLARLRQLERVVDSLRDASIRQQQQIMALDERGPSPIGVTDSARRTLASNRGIYGKPFVRKSSGGTSVGGYVDMEYRYDGAGKRGVFDQHRLIPFIFSEITDRLHFGTEIEFEHAARLEVEDGAASGAGEIKVEFATLDYRLTEAFSFRGGLLLSPLGRFNLMHDSPLNDLTDRPLMAQQIIPTTLSEPGVGFFGTLYPSAQTLLGYEIYVVNGFTDRILDGGVLRVREGRSQGDEENNTGKSLVGRLAFSPFLGLEVGASAHRGPFDVEGNTLTIAALDLTMQRGPIELLGEYGAVSVEWPGGAPPAGLDDRQRGFYLQSNFHFGHGLLKPLPSSVFTAVARWDQVDFASGVDGDDVRRFTFGLNWRPVEEAVLKTDLQWNSARAPGSSAWGETERRFLISMASYF